ncbi:spermatogenesis-associated protein 46-like [Sphaerodactylus townsendi]|uniref:spermatogenesis-associated protein 46-like n=1 Tax=Sphaerodactylus townsendi TaxID=933632 RepID=UPI002027044C|nr:spermatogenesis-associated protein 46-like [Sphaerodactylus townsendi]
MVQEKGQGFCWDGVVLEITTPGEQVSPAPLSAPRLQQPAGGWGGQDSATAQAGAVVADCLLSEIQSDEPLRRNCAIYRPWYSPYSYFVHMDKNSPMDSCSSLGTVSRRDIPEDTGQAEQAAESISSSSGSLKHAHPRENGSRKGRLAPGTKESITSQDILLASRWQPLPQNGYKCMACCRMFPTLHLLKTHIKCGLKEGFSCKVYYQKLKALWEKEHECQFSKCPVGGGSHSSRKRK